MTVTFCGHREVFDKEKVLTELKQIIIELINKGADKFLMGGYGGFDYLAAKTVAELKEEYSHIQSILVIPYLDKNYDMFFYDYSLYPPIEKVPLRFAIAERNKWMVKSSDVVVAYIRHNWGGASSMFEYAKKKKIPIINIVDKKNYA